MYLCRLAEILFPFQTSSSECTFSDLFTLTPSTENYGLICALFQPHIFLPPTCFLLTNPCAYITHCCPFRLSTLLAVTKDSLSVSPFVSSLFKDSWLLFSSTPMYWHSLFSSGTCLLLHSFFLNDSANPLT